MKTPNYFEMIEDLNTLQASCGMTMHELISKKYSNGN